MERVWSWLSGVAVWQSSDRRLAVAGFLTLSGLLAAAGCTEAPTTAPPDDDASGVLRLQEGNDRPRVPLVPKRSGDLTDNRIGAQLYGPVNPYGLGLWEEITTGYQNIRDDILHSGVKRLQTSLTENEPPIDWEASEHDVPPEYDLLIDDMVENGVAVDYLLHFWDKADQGQALSTPRFQDAGQVEDFLEYVRFIVRHYKGRVSYYTIWSEPDNCGQGGIKCIEPQDYIELARQVIPVIHEEDPQAKVGLAPVVLYFALDYLLTVLRSDVTPMFDVVQWHGQFTVIPEDLFYGSYYYDYPAIVEQIKETASAHGFRGEYWSAEMYWCSWEERDPPCNTLEQAEKLASDRLAAKYAARGIVMHLGMDVGAGVESVGEWNGPWGFQTRRRLYTIMAGATPADLPVRIDDAATIARLRNFAFSLPNGDRLFAIWNDTTAVEEDPGRNVTLTFPDISGNAFGLDVLHGFEQHLITETTGGDLLIRDLLVRDYPLILRLER